MVIIGGRSDQIDFISGFELVFEGQERVLRYFRSWGFFVRIKERGLETNLWFLGIEFVFGYALNFDGGQAVVGISGGHFQQDPLVDRDIDCDIGVGREFDFWGDIWDDFDLVDDWIVIGFFERIDCMNSIVGDFSFDRIFSIDDSYPTRIELGLIDLHVESFSGTYEEFVLEDRIEFDFCGLHFLVGDSVDMRDGTFGGFEVSLLLDRAGFEVGVGWEDQVDSIDGYKWDDLNLDFERSCDSVTCMDPIGKRLVQSAGIFAEV